MNKQKTFRLLLKGITAVFIDWANVYGWKKSLKHEVWEMKKGIFKIELPRLMVI